MAGRGPGGGYGAVRPPHAPEATEVPGYSQDNDDESYEDSEESSEDCGHDCCEGDGEEQEAQHFLDVCWSFMDYPRDCEWDIKNLEEAMAQLDPLDAAIWDVDPKRRITEIRARVAANAKFFSDMVTPEVCSADLGHQGEYRCKNIPKGHRVASRNSSKVKSTLRQFVRDWAVEGEAERQTSYQPLIDAVRKYLPLPKPSRKNPAPEVPKVLCPGSGLGRLPFDLARVGYEAQGNEFSYHMLLGSFMLLNCSQKAHQWAIYPFVLSNTNRKGRKDHLTKITIPDVLPQAMMSSHTWRFSMAAGEFVQVYAGQKAYWDAVVSCFFLDTAKNIFLYIRTLADIIKPGGYLINLGPLLYHFAEVSSEISIELSWEEVKPALEKYFEIVEEERRVANYTINPEGMMRVRYNCLFWVARRNNVPATGESNPVYK
eukprot:TRINITY_DN48481_c0_g1_i1.p1 TRINITY_DN48481_c0_g1~~TRINITY_DN48481_c0_g1_i1.p1  ORF type:complete len:429 (+),score=95.45 TRINITY_DN48481_c0_g1_i1:82-1368(+)